MESSSDSTKMKPELKESVRVSHSNGNSEKSAMLTKSEFVVRKQTNEEE